MAITWDIKITVLDVAMKTASIVAVRTDDTNPDNAWTFSLSSALLDTIANKNAELDNIWNHWQAYLTRQAAIDDIVGTLESAAKINLEARE